MKRIRIGQSAAKLTVNKTLVIYAIVNKLNQKVYIGQTIRPFSERKSEHRFDFYHNKERKELRLYQAMRKYGLENFEFNILFNALDISYLNELEVYFINEYNSFKNGYNMTCGGTNASQSLESRKKISNKLKGKRKGIKPTWDRSRMWETRRKREELNPGCYKHPKDCTPSGSNSPLSKTYKFVTCDNEEIVVKGLGQFCKDRNLNYRSILYLLKGEIRSHKGFISARRFND
jgi:group I intron endonuclease